MAGLALSRTCCFADFPGCVTVAAWQQALADTAWLLWTSAHHIRTRSATLVVNYSDTPFIAPGPEAVYHYREWEPVVLPTELPAIFGLCVLDRIEAPVKFLLRASQLLRPEGLLFLTFTCWNSEGEDVAAGAASRRRIYSVHSCKKLVAEARRIGFQGFGGVDWAYHGHTLDDHSLASLVLTRR